LVATDTRAAAGFTVTAIDRVGSLPISCLQILLLEILERYLENL